MKRKDFLFYILLLISISVSAGWQRPVANYTRHAYKAGNQNWSIQQHDNGWIYVANNKGLLEFDGVEWNTYPIHNAKTRAVKVGHDGRIYIGGMEQFGLPYSHPVKSALHIQGDTGHYRGSNRQAGSCGLHKYETHRNLLYAEATPNYPYPNRTYRQRKEVQTPAAHH